MKLLMIFTFATCLYAQANISAQTITLKAEKYSLEKVLREVKKQTQYDYFLTSRLAGLAKPITIVANQLPLDQFLKACFQDQPVTYELSDKSIIIKEKKLPLLTEGLNPRLDPAPPVPIDIHGTVKDENGKPVVGASVQVKGTNKGTTTNNDGEFILTGVDDKATLVISAVNIETREVEVNGKKDISLVAKTKVSQLEDVEITAVNTGYQQLKPNEVTGSYTVINKKSSNLQVGTNILNRLDGIAAGVLFPKQNLQGGPSIMIHGLSTINGIKAPLIVVDNFPYTGDINNINPNDVENITILKDAAATSIWGASAGNGVIVITTQRGKFNQPLKIGFNSNITGTGKPDFASLRTISSTDYIELEKFLFGKGYYDVILNNTSTRPAVSPAVEILAKQRAGIINVSEASAQLDLLKLYDSREQFSKYFYQHSLTQQYSINMQGGGQAVAYFLAGGYDRLTDNLGAPAERYTLRSQSGFRPLRNLEIEVGIQYAQTRSSSGKPAYGTVTMTNVAIPYLQFANATGTPIAINKDLSGVYTDTAGAGKLLSWKYYPLNDWQHQRNTGNLQDIQVNANLKYLLFTGLSVAINAQYERQVTDTRMLADIESYYARNLVNLFSQLNRSTGVVKYNVPNGGILALSNSALEQKNIRVQINFGRTYKLHQVSAFVGAEARQSHITGSGATYFGYDDNTLTSSKVDLINTYPTFINGSFGAIPVATAAVDDKTNRFVSVMGNAAYTYNRKYIFSISGRKDASNLFGVTTNNKWNMLWSAGAGWVISKEGFYHSTAIPYVKLRATFGYGGNTDPSRTALLTFRQSNIGAPTNFNVSTVANLPNPGLRWEKVRTLNAGLDFSSKNGIMDGSVEVYFKKGIDLYGPDPQDPTMGLALQSVITKNIANMEGKGVDITLNAKILNGPFKWQSSLLFGYNQSKTTNYYLDTTLLSASFISNGLRISPMPGQPLYSVIALKWAGLDATGNPQGYWNGQVSTDYNSIYTKTRREDLVYKSAVPVYFGSLINEFSWRRFTLNVCINYRLGYYFQKPTVSYSQLYTSGSVTGTADYGARWQKSGDEKLTNVPSLVYPANANRDAFYSSSEANLLKGDNIRLQFINLGYKLSKSQDKWLPINGLEVYVNASNLGLIWKDNIAGIDPDYISSPVQGKSYTIGMRAIF